MSKSYRTVTFLSANVSAAVTLFPSCECCDLDMLHGAYHEVTKLDFVDYQFLFFEENILSCLYCYAHNLKQSLDELMSSSSNE